MKKYLLISWQSAIIKVINDMLTRGLQCKAGKWCLLGHEDVGQGRDPLFLLRSTPAKKMGNKTLLPSLYLSLCSSIAGWINNGSVERYWGKLF